MAIQFPLDEQLAVSCNEREEEEEEEDDGGKRRKKRHEDRRSGNAAGNAVQLQRRQQAKPPPRPLPPPAIPAEYIHFSPPPSFPRLETPAMHGACDRRNSSPRFTPTYR